MICQGGYMDIDNNVGVQFKSKDVTQCLYSIEYFHGVLKRERFRSDRNNIGFSLIVFETSEKGTDTYLFKHLVETLISRVRFSDEVGWFDERKIAALLPDTSFKGARKLAEIICCKMNETIVKSLNYNVFHYPSQKIFPESHHAKSFGFIEDVNIKMAANGKIPFWKRTMDILGSLFGLFVLSPIFISAALIIKCVSPGPIFFKQERVGRTGKIFTVLKFRTMKVNNDATIHRQYLKKLINGDSNGEQAMIKLDKDPRIICMGNFLRKTCIDELPQLINVLLGDMSLIGPRPCIPYEAEEYLRWHVRRFDITPGMTGLWQVSGKNRTTFKDMIRLDIKYASELSFWLDTRILCKTPLVVISQIFETLETLNNKRAQKQHPLQVEAVETMKIV